MTEMGEYWKFRHFYPLLSEVIDYMEKNITPRKTLYSTFITIIVGFSKVFIACMSDLAYYNEYAQECACVTTVEMFLGVTVVL